MKSANYIYTYTHKLTHSPIGGIHLFRNLFQVSLTWYLEIYSYKFWRFLEFSIILSVAMIFPYYFWWLSF